MLHTEIIEHARKLYDAHGDKAEWEAAQKSKMYRHNGNLKLAREWHKIREAIHQMRGARTR